MKNIKKMFFIGAIISSSILWGETVSKEFLVDLSEQRGYMMENGKIIHEGKISSGRRGYYTPVGTFKITEKKRHHKSNLYPKPNGGAKMPYMMRLNDSPVALHLGYVPSYPDSHGCVRLKDGFAQKVYQWASIGTMVKIVGNTLNYDNPQNPPIHKQYKKYGNKNKNISDIERRSKRKTPTIYKKPKKITSINDYGHDDYDILDYYPVSESGTLTIY